MGKQFKRSNTYPIAILQQHTFDNQAIDLQRRRQRDGFQQRFDMIEVNDAVKRRHVVASQPQITPFSSPD